MKKAFFFETLADKKVRCLLCPHRCLIPEGKIGLCGVRENQKGQLYSLIYEQITSFALDPIEKKPLYHFYQGEHIFSLGTKGCNLACLFCQNFSISQNPNTRLEHISSKEVIKQAQHYKSFGIAYTYNEPVIWYEFVLETATLARDNGLKNVLVTNGYINPEPLDELLPYIDAMNIDLKSIENEFYQKFCRGSLEPVLSTIKRANKECHIELTNLLIPSLNDKDDNIVKLVDWIYDNLGAEVPLHFSRYFPCYKMDLSFTPIETLKKAEGIAKKKLKYVYLGNI